MNYPYRYGNPSMREFFKKLNGYLTIKIVVVGFRILNPTLHNCHRMGVGSIPGFLQNHHSCSHALRGNASAGRSRVLLPPLDISGTPGHAHNAVEHGSALHFLLFDAERHTCAFPRRAWEREVK